MAAAAAAAMAAVVARRSSGGGGSSSSSACGRRYLVPRVVHVHHLHNNNSAANRGHHGKWSHSPASTFSATTIATAVESCSTKRPCTSFHGVGSQSEPARKPWKCSPSPHSRFHNNNSKSRNSNRCLSTSTANNSNSNGGGGAPIDELIEAELEKDADTRTHRVPEHAEKSKSHTAGLVRPC